MPRRWALAGGFVCAVSQTEPSPTARSSGAPSTGIVRSTSKLRGSMRITVWSIAFATQTDPAPTATPAGPTRVRASRAPSPDGAPRGAAAGRDASRDPATRGVDAEEPVGELARDP